MDWQALISFTIIATVIVVSPGPNFLLIARSVAQGGRSVACANIPGFGCAYFLHGMLSIYGVSAILATSPTLFLLIKVLGAAYLLFLGLQSLLAFHSTKIITQHAPNFPTITVGATSLHRAFFDGLLTNILNPKITLFYLAAFPQFLSSTTGATSFSFLLVSIHVLVNAFWFFLIAIVLENLLRANRTISIERTLRKISGISLIGLSMCFMAGAIQNG